MREKKLVRSIRLMHWINNSGILWMILLMFLLIFYPVLLAVTHGTKWSNNSRAGKILTAPLQSIEQFIPAGLNLWWKQKAGQWSASGATATVLGWSFLAALVVPIPVCLFFARSLTERALPDLRNYVRSLYEPLAAGMHFSGEILPPIEAFAGARWFRIAFADPYEVEIECRRCGQKDSFSPKAQERPPDRCGKCGLS